MQAITTIGLDIAKSVFQVHGVDADGRVVVRRHSDSAGPAGPGRADLSAAYLRWSVTRSRASPLAHGGR